MTFKKAGALLILWTIGVPLFSQRIVTLAPALTEIVFALGKGNQIVGNTRFCDFPIAARRVTKVGGLIDFNLELFVSLKPEVVIVYPELYEKVKFIGNRSSLILVHHASLNDLFSSIQLIAEALSVPERGQKMIQGISSQLKEVQNRLHGKTSPRAMLIAGRNPDDLRNVYIIGKQDFLNEILEISGGVNAYRGTIAYPSVSMESIIAMNPDWIIELSAFHESLSETEIGNLWQRYGMLRAVQRRHVRFIRDNFWLRPGPRVALIAENLYRLFHHD